VGKVLLLLWVLLLRISRKAWRCLLNWRSSSGVVAYRLSAHHGLDFFHAHGFSGRRRLLRRGGGLRRRLSLCSWLLGLEAPNIGARFQLGNVLGVLVALVASSVGLGRLWDGRSLLVLLLVLRLVLLLLLLLLGVVLTSLVQHLLFLQGA
jgi:hypothetical protein